jgi:hypothetical protein
MAPLSMCEDPRLTTGSVLSIALLVNVPQCLRIERPGEQCDTVCMNATPHGPSVVSKVEQFAVLLVASSKEDPHQTSPSA